MTRKKVYLILNIIGFPFRVKGIKIYECYHVIISIIGRKSNNAGPLCNLTDGGEGSVNIDEDIKKRANLVRELRGHNKRASKRMKENNPMFSQDIVKKVRNTNICNGLYNGAGFNFKSKNPDVRAKISETRKRKIASGEIKHPEAVSIK